MRKPIQYGNESSVTIHERLTNESHLYKLKTFGTMNDLSNVRLWVDVVKICKGGGQRMFLQE